MLSKFSIFYLLVGLLATVYSQTEPIVKLPQGGEVTGVFEQYKRDNEEIKYSVFRGIPYAKPPIDSLRFKNPEKHDGWASLDAKDFRSKCPQWNSKGEAEGNEDCLFINVYTPLTRMGSSPSADYPVMVFLHGGNFQKGSSDQYEQKKFIEYGVVLVTLNYRLGILGFLSTGDDNCPGNLGLKDQVLALQWIRDNIKSFGGNSSSITLFGQGAGAVSVFLHILSPESQGLFHNAITQSGSPLCDWTVEEHPYSYAVEVAERLRCSTKSTSAMMDCIKKKPLQDLLEAQKDNKTFGDYPLRTTPVIEKKGFLPDSPEKLLRAGDFKPIPLISGINKDDGAILYPLIRSYEEILKKDSKDLLKKLIPMFLLTATDIRGNIESVSQAVYFQYFNGIDPKNVTQVLQPFVNMTTDAMFVSCNDKTLELYSSRARVYMYTLEYKGKYSMLQLNDGNKYTYDGVSHGDELLYLFDFKNAPLSLPYDVKKKEQFSFLWSTFARTGLPPSEVTFEFPRWEPYTSESKNYYKIDVSITKASSYRQREIDFWLNHLPEMSKIIPATEQSPAKIEVGGFGWSMLAIAIILLVVAIVLAVMLLRKSKSQYFATKTEEK